MEERCRRWAAPAISHDGWERIILPNTFEAGRMAMDGAVWFRKEVQIPGRLAGKDLVLHLGRINDLDITYWNGKKVGETDASLDQFWLQERTYRVPGPSVRAGRNVVAVRVWDAYLRGGMMGPERRMYVAEAGNSDARVSLHGLWKIGIERRIQAAEKDEDIATDWVNVGYWTGWAEEDFDDSEWGQIRVPGPFERKFYLWDGAVWFRKKVKLPSSWQGQRLVLRLGMIDDYDRTYFNGHLVGHTDREVANAARLFREYTVPGEYVRRGTNLIAVRVFDAYYRCGFTGDERDMILFPEEDAEKFPREPSPPWKPRYRIYNHEQDKLTAADVPGPDGLAYPDFTYAGVEGGIPEVERTLRLGMVGGKPDDGRDDSDAFERGIEQLAQQGGGALLLSAGTYHLDRPIVITHDGIVIRGVGMDQTTIVNRYGFKEGEVSFAFPRPGQTIDGHSPIVLHAFPEGLESLRVYVNDTRIGRRRKMNRYATEPYSLQTYLFQSEGRIKRGAATLRGLARWRNGKSASCEIPVTVREPGVDERNALVRRRVDAAILFTGHRPSPPAEGWKLARDGKRGDTVLHLQSGPDLTPGDFVLLKAAPTERWAGRIMSARARNPRACMFKVVGEDGRQVTLNQPLRIDFPMVDEPVLTKENVIRWCGVEDLTLEQTRKLWSHGIAFNRAANCWTRGVKVRKPGRNGINLGATKFFELRDSAIVDGWYKGGGGTGYLHLTMSWDCLIDNVWTVDLRHAPIFNSASGGNVVRNSLFAGSDLQWHSGWCYENLVENCQIVATEGSGAYGYGAYATVPEAKAHGPGGGPRNVIYNNSFYSRKSGLYLGGSNEAWIVAHNRFEVEEAPGMRFRHHSFDHTIRENVVVINEPWHPGVLFEDANCLGIRLKDNTFCGAVKVFTGAGSPDRASGNRVLDREDYDGQRPRPAVPSVYEWQKQR
jgi:hypothetical protein